MNYANTNATYNRYDKWHYEEMYYSIHLRISIICCHNHSFVFSRIEARKNCTWNDKRREREKEEGSLSNKEEQQERFLFAFL